MVSYGLFLNRLNLFGFATINDNIKKEALLIMGSGTGKLSG